MKTDDTLIASVDPALLADLDPYRLLREIGRGGMSVVYEALDTRTGQRVALKVLSLPFAVTAVRRTDLVARFRREERAVSQLSHPNIVAIQEIGERAGVHFIAMEYLPGESLRARLERGPLTLPEASGVLNQIAAALTAVHGAGIVHRDVKPSNVMLLPDGGAKLLDFGVARHADDTAITSGGLVVGSPAYLSPEQVRGGAGTPASDVWALGVLLYEMLAGHPPFQATDVAAVMYQVIHEPPRPVPSLPPAVAKVLKRALDKAPERRFPSPQSLAEAFGAARPAAAPPVRSAVLPRWAWATLPLFFLAAVLASYSARRTPSPPPATLIAAPAPVSAVTMPAVSAPPAAVLPAAVRRTAKPAAAPTQAAPPLLAEMPPAAPATVETGTVPSRPAAVRRPRPVRPQAAAAAPLPSPPVAAALPPRRPEAAPPRPAHVKPVPQAERPAQEVPTAPAPPRETFTPTPVRPAVPAAKSRAARKKEQDEEAAEAERLQKFIWSEGR